MLHYTKEGGGGGGGGISTLKHAPTPHHHHQFYSMLCTYIYCTRVISPPKSLLYLAFSSVIPVVTVRVSPSGPVIEGSTVDLVCEATAGDLPISYSWTGPSGQDVSLADTDGTISVTISASGDYGTYTCAATNEFGMGNASVEVIQAGTCMCI